MSVESNHPGLVVPVIQKKQSLRQDPAFQNVKSKAETWLGTKTIPGKEMDSVFFNNDRFELIVDTRGYRPEDLKCVVGLNTIEVFAQRVEVLGGTQRNMSTSRNYQLPQLIIPQQAMCCLSSEGILLVAVPWQK